MLQPRLYASILDQQLAESRRVVFLSGPRQVGKTTVCESRGDLFLDWDNEDHRDVILGGPGGVARLAGLQSLSGDPPVITFDGLHRYRGWRAFLEEFLDNYEHRVRVLVAGSVDPGQAPGSDDRLQGRYLPLRMHPLSVAEVAQPWQPDAPVRSPAPVSDEDWQALWDHGGFPEPFRRRNSAFTNRWREQQRARQWREDLRNLTRIQELDQLEVLERRLADRSGEPLVYSALARTVRVSENTVRSWIATLESLHHGFPVRPWHQGLAGALRKEPRWYVRDWSGLSDPGKRFETMCACHLLKAVEGWTDLGFGAFELRYLRDRQGRGVDFVIVRDGRPWCLLEVALAERALAPALAYFQERTGAPHAFQVVAGLPFADIDVFTRHDPVVVPARTLLSQLL